MYSQKKQMLIVDGNHSNKRQVIIFESLLVIVSNMEHVQLGLSVQLQAYALSIPIGAILLRRIGIRSDTNTRTEHCYPIIAALVFVCVSNQLATAAYLRVNVYEYDAIRNSAYACS